MPDDYLKAAQAMRRRLGPMFPVEEWNQQVMLPWLELQGTVPFIEDLKIFVRALPVMDERYRRGRSEPTFSSSDLRDASWPPEEIRAVWRVLQVLPSLQAGATWTSHDEWRFTLSPIVPKVAHAATPEELRHLVDNPTGRYRRQAQILRARLAPAATKLRKQAWKVAVIIILGAIGSLVGTWAWEHFFAFR